MMTACRFIPGASRTLIAGLGVLLLLTAAPSRPADAHAVRDETPRIAIISAFAPELAILKSDLEDASEFSVNGVIFSTGILEGHEVVLFPSGISVVNAAMTTQLAFDHFAIRDVVFSGIAGGVDPGLNIGDVVIADRWGQYLETLFARETADGWATMPFFEYPYGHFGMMFPRSVTVLRPGAEHPETRFWFTVDDRLFAAARSMADNVALRRCTTEGSCLEQTPRIVIGGPGVSGSAFVDNVAFRTWTFQTFDAHVLDMESAAVAHVAYANDIPFIAVRSLSDLAGGGEGANQLEIFLGLAADNATTVVKALLRAMGEEP